MSCQSEFPEPASAPDQAADDAQYYRRVLHELIDMGADLARLVHQRALAPAGAGEPGDDSGLGQDASAGIDVTVAFDRVCRTVRRSVMLARKVAEPVAEERPARNRVVARTRIIRAVEDAIQRSAEDGGEAEALEAELLERLDAPELEDDIAGRPVDEIIGEICRDLGLDAEAGTQPWKRRTPEDVALLCARARSRVPVAQVYVGAGSRGGWAGSDPPAGADGVLGYREAWAGDG